MPDLERRCIEILREAAHCVNPNTVLAHRIRDILLEWSLLQRPCQQCGGSVGHAASPVLCDKCSHIDEGGEG